MDVAAKVLPAVRQESKIVALSVDGAAACLRKVVYAAAASKSPAVGDSSDPQLPGTAPRFVADGLRRGSSRILSTRNAAIRRWASGFGCPSQGTMNAE